MVVGREGDEVGGGGWQVFPDGKELVHHPSAPYSLNPAS